MKNNMVKQMLTISLFAMMPFIANAQENNAAKEQADSLIVPKLSVNSHFYTQNLPLDMSYIKTIGSVKYGKNERLTVITLRDSVMIPKEWEKYEIPRSRVKNLPEIEDCVGPYVQMASLTEKGMEADTLVNKTLPGSFALHDLDGNLWTEQSLKGHKVVINAWYSGCGPCLREMPILSEWKTKYPDVTFLSVNFEKADKVRKITEQRRFNWTHLYGDDYFVKLVGTGGFPLFIVLGEDGLVHYLKNGTNDKIRQDIQAVIEGL